MTTLPSSVIVGQAGSPGNVQQGFPITSQLREVLIKILQPKKYVLLPLTICAQFNLLSLFTANLR